jgi:hypothetical protein
MPLVVDRVVGDHDLLGAGGECRERAGERDDCCFHEILLLGKV